jgi:hypothetical protein
MRWYELSPTDCRLVVKFFVRSPVRDVRHCEFDGIWVINLPRENEIYIYFSYLFFDRMTVIRVAILWLFTLRAVIKGGMFGLRNKITCVNMTNWRDIFFLLFQTIRRKGSFKKTKKKKIKINLTRNRWMRLCNESVKLTRDFCECCFQRLNRAQ